MMQKVRRRRGLKNMVQTPNLKRFRNHFEIYYNEKNRSFDALYALEQLFMCKIDLLLLFQ